MPIEKLPEFAKDGQKNTDDLTLIDGFPVGKKPARQWFNWLFNALMLKINEVIDVKLDKTANAVSATKLETSHTVSFSGAATGSFNFDGSSNSSAVLTLANSGVAASTYGGNLKIPVVTVNAKGLITGVSEQNIPIVDNLTTDDALKPVSAKQAKNLQDNKLGKTENAASATNLITGSTAFTDDINFIKSFAGSKSTSWFDNGQGKFFAQYSTGLSASFYEGGTFAIGTEVLTGKTKVISGVVRDNGVVDLLQSHEIAYVENVLAKSGGTLTGELTAPGVRTSNFFSDVDYNFYGMDNSIAQRIKCGGLLTSYTWSDMQYVPLNGIFSRGDIWTAGVSRATLFHAETANLQVVNGTDYTIVYDYATRLVHIQMRVFTNLPIYQGLPNSGSATSLNLRDVTLPITLRKRLHTQAFFTTVNAAGVGQMGEAYEWMWWTPPPGIDGATDSKVRISAKRWTGTTDEACHCDLFVTGYF